jgi:hypothetical protein
MTGERLIRKDLKGKNRVLIDMLFCRRGCRKS